MQRTDSRGRESRARRSVGTQMREGGRNKEWNQHGGRMGVRERLVYNNAYCFGSRIVLTHGETWDHTQERNVKPTCQRTHK